MEQKEFTSISGRHYREKKTSIIELMSVVDYYDTDDLQKLETLNAFALEHLEVNIKDVWMPVKMKNQEVYMPADLAEDVVEARDIIQQYLDIVLKPVFQKSIESVKKRAALVEQDK